MSATPNPFSRLCMMEGINAPRLVEVELKRLSPALLAKLEAERKLRNDVEADNRAEAKVFPAKRNNFKDS